MSYDVGGLGLAGDKSGKRKRYMYVGITVDGILGRPGVSTIAFVESGGYHPR